MLKTVLVNTATQIVGYDRRLNARAYPSGPDPEQRIDGLSFGVATMSNDAPHGTWRATRCSTSSAGGCGSYSAIVRKTT